MSKVREFPSVTITNNSNLVQINTNDSNFSVVPGSVIFIAGDRPRVVTSGDTVNRTLTLAIAYAGNDIVEKSATLIPLGQNNALLAAITSLTQAQNGLADAYENVSEISFDDVLGILGENQLPSSASTKRDVMRVSPAFDTSKGRQAFEHNHYDQLAKNVSPLPPTIGPLKPVELHFDTTQKKTWVMWGHNGEDAQPIEQYLGRRHFYQADSPLLIAFDDLFTGAITMRVYVFHVTIDSVTHLSGTHEIKGLPGSPTLTLGQWVTFTASVTDFDEIGTDRNGNYFYGLVDYISLSDGRFADLSKPYFPRIPQLNATITNTSNNASNPFIVCNQRLDGTWETADITPSTPMTIYSSWVQNGRKFTATNVSGGNDRVEFFSTSYLDGKTVEYAVALHSLSSYTALATLNSNSNIIDVESVRVFTATSERLALKRNYGSLSGTAEVLYIKQLIPELS